MPHSLSLVIKGYQKSPEDKHTLLVDEAAAATIQQIFDLFIGGLSTYEIARKFNVEGVLTPLQTKRTQSITRKWNCVDQNSNYWTSGMVRKILNDERYTGKAVYGKTTRKKVGAHDIKRVAESQWTVVEDAIPAIIPRELFEKVKELSVSSHSVSPKVSNRIFYRKVRCGHCRLAMTRMEGVNPYYICQTYRKKPDIGCPQDKMSEKELEQVVLASIRAMAQFVRKAEKARQRKSDKADRYNQRIEQKIQAHENSIKMRQQEKMSAFEDIVSGLCDEPEYKRRCSQCNEHIRRLEQKISELQNEKRQLPEEKSPVESVLPYTNVRTLTRELVDLLIQHIYIYSDTSVEIVWKFEDEYKRLLAEMEQKGVDERV